MAKTKLGAGALLYPMPITLVGANVKGKPNYCVVAFCGVMNAKPPILYVSLNRKHYTAEGIRENKSFSVNIPSTKMVEKTDYCGLVSGGKVDKSKLFDAFYGELKTAPMIGECAINLECRLLQTVEFDIDITYIGEVVEAYADERLQREGALDTEKIDPILFTLQDRRYWRMGDFIGDAWSIGSRLKSNDNITQER